METLREAIKNGNLNIGDSYSLAQKNTATSSTTGHAMVVVDIVKDKNGNVTSYTVQGNNPHEFFTFGINDKSERAVRRGQAGVRTSVFMEGKIENEKQDLSKLSTAELEAEVVKQRGETEQVIADLKETETHFVESKNYNKNAASGFAQGYAKQYAAAKNDVQYNQYKAYKLIEADKVENEKYKKDKGFLETVFGTETTRNASPDDVIKRNEKPKPTATPKVETKVTPKPIPAATPKVETPKVLTPGWQEMVEYFSKLNYKEVLANYGKLWQRYVIC